MRWLATREESPVPPDCLGARRRTIHTLEQIQQYIFVHGSSRDVMGHSVPVRRKLRKKLDRSVRAGVSSRHCRKGPDTSARFDVWESKR